MSIWGAVVGMEFTQSDLGVNLLAGCRGVGGTSPEFLFAKQPFALYLSAGCSGLQTAGWGLLGQFTPTSECIWPRCADKTTF